MTIKSIPAAVATVTGLALSSIIGLAAPGSAAPDLRALAQRQPAAASQSGLLTSQPATSATRHRATRRRGRQIRARLLADGETSQAAALSAGGWVAHAGRGSSRVAFRADVQQHLMATGLGNELNFIQGVAGVWHVLPKSAVARRALELLNKPAATYEFTAAPSGELSEDLTSLLALVRDDAERAPLRAFRMHTTRGGRTYRILGPTSGERTELRFDTRGVLRTWVVGGTAAWSPGVRLRIKFAYTPVALSQPTPDETVTAADFGSAMVAADLRHELRQAVMHGPVAALPNASPDSSRRLLLRRAQGAVSYFNGMDAGFNARWWKQGKSVFVAATNPYTSQTVTLRLRLQGRRIQVTDA